MPDTFQILAGFLERFDHEVEGRELSEPPEDVRRQLSLMARGALPAVEREKLLGVLNQHPQWLEALAVEVKALRGGPGRKS